MKSFRAAFCIFYCSNSGRFLLEHRSNEVKNGNRYGMFGGGIEKGEEPIEGLKRELFEETGYRFNHFDVLDTTLPVLIAGKLVKKEFIPKLSWESDGFLWTSEFPYPLHKQVKRNLPSLMHVLYQLGWRNNG